MSITPYLLDDFDVDPETNRVVGVALEKTRVSLGLADDFANGIIAKRLIELAKAGERNPDLLCEGAIEHDGFRVIARKDGTNVRLYSRPGNDLTYRFPLIVESLARCAHGPASSTARRSRSTTTAWHPSIASAIAATMPPCSSMPST